MKIEHTVSSGKDRFLLTIDDIAISIDDAYLDVTPYQEVIASIFIKSPKSYRKILNAKPIDFLPLCSELAIVGLEISIDFPDPEELSETYPELKFGSLFLSDIYFSDILTAGGNCKVEIAFSHRSDCWKNPWSIVEYADEFESLVRQDNQDSSQFYTLNFQNDNLFQNDDTIVVVELTHRYLDCQKSLDEFISPYLEELLKIQTEVVENLSLKLYPNSIVTYFNFPKEIETACEQYLLYFVRFLQDIGINATAELKEDTPGKVLFVVTPENQAEALDTIRKALAVYLNIPAQVDVYHPVNLSQEIAIQRLVAQVQHFQSQLTLARAELQLRAATIQQKDKLIHQQQQAIEQQILSQNVLLESMQKDADDAEPVLGDLVSVKKYEGEWVEVNLPSILRYLKRLFNKT